MIRVLLTLEIEIVVKVVKGIHHIINSNKVNNNRMMMIISRIRMDNRLIVSMIISNRIVVSKGSIEDRLMIINILGIRLLIQTVQDKIVIATTNSPIVDCMIPI